MGMRHRAGLCLSDETDAVVLIVSEESGRISVAVGGRLEPVARENLSRRLVDLLSGPPAKRASMRRAAASSWPIRSLNSGWKETGSY